jgi:hypothetical protein
MLATSLALGERNVGTTLGPKTTPDVGGDVCGPLPEVESVRYSPVTSPFVAAAPTRFNAARTSSIDRKRSSGALRMQRAIVSSSSGEACAFGFISQSGIAVSFTCAIRMLTLVELSKGTLPVTISYMMTPSA